MHKFETYKKNDNNILIARAPSIDGIKKHLQKFYYQDDLNLIVINDSGEVFNNKIKTHAICQKIIKKSDIYGYIALFKN